MTALANFVLETASAPGTASVVTLAGAAAGRVSFASVFGSGTTTFYFLDDGTQAEWGYGVLTVGSPNTFNRATVIGNTAGTTARLNFSGATRIYNEVPASRILYADPGTGNVIVPASAVITGHGQAVNPGDAPRLSQVAWQTLGEVVITGSTLFASFAIPSGLVCYGIEWLSAQPVANAAAVVQFSFNGGSAWSTNCQWAASGASFASAPGVYAGGVPPSLSVVSGRALCLNPPAKTLIVDSVTYFSRFSGGGIDLTSGLATNIRFTFDGSNIAAGVFRLIGGT